MDLTNFNKAEGLRARIRRHTKALEYLTYKEEEIQDMGSAARYNQFQIGEETYPNDVSLPIIRTLIEWHQSSIAKHEADFARL